MRIVFCEDEAIIRKLIELSLRSTAHEFRMTADGREALDLVRRWRPDVLITDVAMPGMDGIELAETVRRDPELSGLPIVFMSASTRGEAEEQAGACRPVAYLRKPFGPSALRGLLGSLALSPPGLPADPEASPSHGDR
jgi:CheY-like chemotaxis protein